MRPHRLIIGLVGINVVLLAALLVQGHRVSAVGDPATVRARAIELVDERGRIRAQLNVEADGEAVFRLRDAAGEIRVKLGAGGMGPACCSLTDRQSPASTCWPRAAGPA